MVRWINISILGGVNVARLNSFGIMPQGGDKPTAGKKYLGNTIVFLTMFFSRSSSSTRGQTDVPNKIEPEKDWALFNINKASRTTFQATVPRGLNQPTTTEV